jgi:hypothetical protein
MPITTFTSREFNQDTSRAKKAASHGPVFKRTVASLLMCSSALMSIANSRAGG